MMRLDLNKLAVEVQQAHLTGKPMCLPAMRMSDIATLTHLLRQLESPASTLVH